MHICHERSVRRHLGVSLEQDFFWPELLSQCLCRGRILPTVEVVWSDVHGFLVLVKVTLKTVWDNDRLVMSSEVLDQCRWCFNHVAVQPQHPRSGGTQRREEKAISGFAHRRATFFLCGHGMSFGLCLADGRLVILSQDGDGSKTVLVRRCLRPSYALLQLLRSQVSFPTFRDYEAQRDEIMRVRELAQVLPVLRVEARERCQDQHGLAIADGVACGGDVVHVIVHDRRRRSDLVRAQAGGLAERQRRRGKGVGGGILGLEQLLGRGGERGDGRVGSEEEEEEEDGEQHGQHVCYGITPTGDGHRLSRALGRGQQWN